MEESVHINRIYIDKKYNFFELFNPENGTLIRSNIFGTKKDPIKRSFPELIDVGIMGHCLAGRKGVCKNAGIDCYQNGPIVDNMNMTLDDYAWIINQCKDKVFQVALGGAGDPNKHTNFREILELTRKNNIVPNLTTSGLNITDNEIDLIETYCGAVAVSYYSRLINGEESNKATIDVIRKFIKNDCKTNVHYVVSNETISEAIYRLEKDYWPEGINAVIFLLYKPVGFGTKDKILKSGKQLSKFLNLAVNKMHPYRVGFDTCFTTALLSVPSINLLSVDSCEASRFSMYIHSDLVATPCSFDNISRQYAYKLKPNTIREAWNSEIFSSFLKERDACSNCAKYEECFGGCGLNLGIDLCN